MRSAATLPRPAARRMSRLVGSSALVGTARISSFTEANASAACSASAGSSLVGVDAAAFLDLVRAMVLVFSTTGAERCVGFGEKGEKKWRPERGWRGGMAVGEAGKGFGRC